MVPFIICTVLIYGCFWRWCMDSFSTSVLHMLVCIRTGVIALSVKYRKPCYLTIQPKLLHIPSLQKQSHTVISIGVVIEILTFKSAKGTILWELVIFKLQHIYFHQERRLLPVYLVSPAFIIHIDWHLKQTIKNIILTICVKVGNTGNSSPMRFYYNCTYVFQMIDISGTYAKMEFCKQNYNLWHYSLMFNTAESSIAAWRIKGLHLCSHMMCAQICRLLHEAVIHIHCFRMPYASLQLVRQKYRHYQS